MEKLLLKIDDLSVDFHTAEGTVHAINSLSYDINEGETLGIVGESGSGKSVSSLAIMQLIPNPPGEIVNGKIIYDNKDILTISEREISKIRGNEISMIFQEPMTSLNPIHTCGKQISESLILHRGMKKKEAMKEAIQLMRSVGIANPEQRVREYPHQMSGGMRQRVMIAMALACKPRLLICDEPTTALDVTIQAQILDLIHELNRETGTAVIMISHDLGVVSEICSRVLVMYMGKIVEEATSEDIFSTPLHPYTIGLLKAIPKIGEKAKVLTAIPGSVPNPTEKIEGCSFWPRCEYATAKCKTQIPPMYKISDNRKVRCFRLESQSICSEVDATHNF